MEDAAADTEHKAKLVSTIEGRLPVDTAATEHSEESYALQSTARKLQHSSKLMSTEEEAMIDQVLASEARLLLAKIARKVFLHMPRDTPHHELLQMILELQDTQEQLMLQANTVHTANRKLIQEVETLRKQSPERAPVKAPFDDIPVKAPPGNLPRPPPRADSDRQVSPPLKAPPATDPDTLAGRWRTSVDVAYSPYLARLAACDH